MFSSDCLGHYNFGGNITIRTLSSITLFFSFKIVLSSLGFEMNIGIVLLISAEKVLEILIRIIHYTDKDDSLC